MRLRTRRLVKWSLVLLAAAGAAALGAAGGLAVFLASGGGRVFPRVTLAGRPLGGLTRAEAAAVVRSYEAGVIQRPLEVVAPGRRVTVTARQLGLRVDVAATVEQAYRLGRRGSLPGRWRTWVRLLTRGARVAPVFRNVNQGLRPLLVGLAAEAARPALNARFDPATGRLSAGADGQEVVVPESLRRVLAALVAPGERQVEVAVRSVRPSVSLAELRKAGIRRVLARYQTRFDPSDQNRVHNIALAATALDGALIRPGEVWSFNRTVGPRTVERGYRSAPEIVREKYVLGIGGGTCQVSSTLYNAALLAGLEIPERSAHSQPLGYVPPGRDATVYFGLIDLKIRNTRTAPVVIATAVGRDTLSIALCGQEDEFPEVRIETGPLEPLEPGPEVVEVDPALATGVRQVVEEARLGYRVKVFRLYLRQGTQVASEVISTDLYPPRPRRVKVGPPATGTPPADKSPATPGRPASPSRPEAPRDVDLSTPVLYNEAGFGRGR
ncbi:MAG: VanW family protein [Chitinophagales bacterium]